MQNLKNIAVGFLVSFLGSIPLGYLNVIGFDIYNSEGIRSTIFYLLGVICVEFCVIFLTLIFANVLFKREKLLKFIEAFSVVFMFVLAFVFYSSAKSDDADKAVFSNFGPNFFFSGIVFSCLNFIQVPFWLSWNLYLLNGKYIEISNSRKYFYIFGTIAGTFVGMLVLILSLHYFAENVDFLSRYLMQIIIPLVFLGLGILQGIKFYRKYYR
jgi:threonine/homoserine/homoserine lactone efflux protein